MKKMWKKTVKKTKYERSNTVVSDTSSIDGIFGNPNLNLNNNNSNNNNNKANTILGNVLSEIPENSEPKKMNITDLSLETFFFV